MLELGTPALLFPAVSLILLAYTNRFLALSSLIRELHQRYANSHEESICRQIHLLRRRVLLIRDMQALGIASLFFCVLTMILLYWHLELEARLCFGLSLLLMLASLAWSFREIQLSTNALNLQLSDIVADDDAG